MSFACLLLVAAAFEGRAEDVADLSVVDFSVVDLRGLERSFWLHASLAEAGQRGYWGPKLPASKMPSEEHVRNAARLLSTNYAANRLYLVYHKEIPLGDMQQVFGWWRQYCPDNVEVVPTLVLKMYDSNMTPVFDTQELNQLADFFQRKMQFKQLGVYDVYPQRDQGESLKLLQRRYPKGLIRVGVQPSEQIERPFAAAVQDTWSGLCHGKTNEDWQDEGFGAETLSRWVEQRNQQSCAVAWDLIAVAWDYSSTERGGYPGYDDAAKNMPLPTGRNRLAARLVLRIARPATLGGFSSDLLIVQANSRDAAHDGQTSSFYTTLKQGNSYRGYYSKPFHEIVSIYKTLRNGKWPEVR
jgi:hypothetical protein